jgi:hypothetical protein
MNFLNNMKIGTRLIALTVVSSIILIIVGASGLWGIQRSTAALAQVYDRHLLSINHPAENPGDPTAGPQRNLRGAPVQGRLRRPRKNSTPSTVRSVRSANCWIPTRSIPLTQRETTLLDAYLKARLVFGRDGVEKMRELLTGEKFDEAEKPSTPRP